MKCNKVALAAILSAAMICGCTSDEGQSRGTIGNIEETTPTPAPVKEPTQAPTPTMAPVNPDPDPYGIMSEWDFEFSSGAGGWGTSLKVDPKGGFSGCYSDSDMGSTGPGHPGGTVYMCEFNGRFTDYEKVSDYIYNLTIGEIEYKNTPGTNAIINDILYEYTEPYGIGTQTELTVFLPGARFKDLPDGFVDWMNYGRFGASSCGEYYRDYPEFLYFCGLYNPGDQCGFSSVNNTGKNSQYLINTANLAGLKNIEANIEDDNTYYYVDESDGSLMHIENCCFKADPDSDISWKEDEFVDMCLDRTGHHPNNGSLSIYGKAYRDDSNFAKYTSVNGNTSVLASWTQGSNEDTGWYLGIFSQMMGAYDYVTGDVDRGYAYAYIIYLHPDYSPYTSYALQCYLSSLDFSGTPDRLSSASSEDLDEYASSYAIVTAGKDPDHIEADLVELKTAESPDLIDPYEPDANSFTGIDQDYTTYTLSDDCPIYTTFTDNLFNPLLSHDELYDRLSDDPDGGLMYLYFNKDGEVVFIHEIPF